MNTLIAWFSWSGNTRDIAERIARKTRGEEDPWRAVSDRTRGAL